MKREKEIGRKIEVGSRKLLEALSIAVGFSQRTTEANSFYWLQPHILKMWLKPTLLFICYPLAEANGNKEFQQ